MAEAVARMLDTSFALGVGRGDPRNERVNLFLRELLNRSDPVNLDHPQDIERADGGERVRNINKINRAAEGMITIEC